MKNNLLHICFVLDESGSMYSSSEDVIGGFSRLVEEQRSQKEGECLISLFTFNHKVSKRYIGVPVNEVTELKYIPSGCTAMNDGIGTAIDEVGKWLCDMKEEDRPCKNLIVIMTDGRENSSSKYSLETVKDMIKHQEEKYSWSFVYMGTDLNSLDDADDLGISLKSISDRSNVSKNYQNINGYAQLARSAQNSVDWENATSYLSCELDMDTSQYLAKN